MAKKESTFTNMVLTLFLVTLIASTALALVYEVTKGPIKEAKRLKKMNAISEVVPDFDNDPGSEMKKLGMGKDSLYFYQARNGGELTGIAVESFTYSGFSGLVKIMVGFLPDGSIYDISVLEQAETPGLGDKIIKSKSFDKNTGLSWSSQFGGKNPENFALRVKKDDGDVDAITAATITSRAFCDAVQRAYDGMLVLADELEIDTGKEGTEEHNAD
ncbi:MAG: RnfABCDGE type electron transport complex subunit G [Bacteroidales bacterium]|nr:RnfABCDGE type electron transport complex subunit G [Bacteroidales bacterium]